MKIIAWVISLLALDQGTKYWARTELETPMSLLSWFELQLSFNTGIAFSIPLPAFITIILAILVIVYLAWQLSKIQPRLTYVAFVLILAGALGNLIDRLYLGAVTDFISVGLFPIFNLADSFICVGVVAFVWQEIVGPDA